MLQEQEDLNKEFKSSFENFSIEPSASIWEKVEADIRLRERKRRIIIFFFTTIALLSGGLLLYYIGNPAPIQTTVTHKKIKQAATNTENATIQNATSLLQNSTLEKANASHARNRQDSKYQSENVSSLPAIIQKTAQASNEKPFHYPQPQTQSPITKHDTTGNVVLTVQNFVKSNLEVQEILEKPLTIISIDSIPKSRDSITVKTNDSISTDVLMLSVKDSVLQNDKKSRWSIGIGVSPAMSFVKHKEKGSYQIVAAYRDSTDKPTVQLNYQVYVNYEPVPKIEIYSGIMYVQLAQKIKNQQAVYFYDSSKVTTSPTPIVTVHRAFYNINDKQDGNTLNKFTYVAVPLGLRYQLYKKSKISFYLVPEMAYHKLILVKGYRYDFENFEYVSIRKVDLKASSFSYGGGISINYAINNHLQFEIVPTYKNFSKSIYIAAYPYSERFQQYAVQLNLRYMLN